MVLAPFGESRLVVQLEEKSLAKLSLGQKAVATLRRIQAQ